MFLLLEYLIVSLIQHTSLYSILRNFDDYLSCKYKFTPCVLFSHVLSGAFWWTWLLKLTVTTVFSLMVCMIDISKKSICIVRSWKYSHEWYLLSFIMYLFTHLFNCPFTYFNTLCLIFNCRSRHPHTNNFLFFLTPFMEKTIFSTLLKCLVINNITSITT